MILDPTNAIRVLTATSLAGLLLAVGLRVTWLQTVNAIRTSHLGWVLPANFIFVPAFTILCARAMHLPTDISVGMALLAASPFAPVVPIFTKMARGDLALAAGLTALFPVVSAFLTPLICQWSLLALPGTEALRFSSLTILIVLGSTITLPLAAGLAIHHYAPALGRKILRPMEIFSEAAGALSLTFVTAVEFKTITGVGWRSLLVMAMVFEVSLMVGYLLSGPTTAVRRVLALGTSNRNIALAILVAISSFPDTPIVAAVVANGLLLIFLGLLHVAWWRFVSPGGSPSTAVG